MSTDGCCGQTNRKPVRRTPPEKLPPNPNVAGGIPIMYLGAGHIVIKGAVSGLIYHLSDRRRHFNVHPGDVDPLLSSRYFIVQP